MVLGIAHHGREMGRQRSFRGIAIGHFVIISVDILRDTY